MSSKNKQVAKPRADGKQARETKKSQLVRMLTTKRGATIEAISGKLGWQQHTTRAAITGLKKSGYAVAAEKQEADKPTRYRVVAQATAVTASMEVADAGQS